MSLQEEFEAAGVEYARRLTERDEKIRLAALATEAAHGLNAQAFAEAVEASFTDHDHEQETTE